MIKRAIIVILVSLGICAHSWASHVIGGEIQVTYLSGFQYEIKSLVYYDFSGTIVPPPFNATINIYQRDNVVNPVASVTIPISSIDSSQSYPCGNTIYDFATAVYDTVLTLSPTIFNSQSGYVLVHDRGPGANHPNTQSLAFAHYTLMPPVVDGAGNPIINSSPVNREKFETQIICTSEDNTINMSSIDPDGDSLAYTFFTPAASGAISAGTTSPKFSPHPDPTTQFSVIQWGSVYSQNAQIIGNAPNTTANTLSIDSVSGIMSVNPENVLGIFLVAVAVEEYRDINNDGVKEIIGVVYKTMGYNVLPCPWYLNQAPSIELVKPDSDFCIAPFQTDTFDICSFPTVFGVKISDPDSNSTYSFKVISTLDTAGLDPLCGEVKFKDSVQVKVLPSDTLTNELSIFSCAHTWDIDQVDVFIEDMHPCGKVAYDTLTFWIRQSFPESLEGFDQTKAKVYPNPVSERLIIDLEAGSQSNEFQVFNLQGRLIHNESLQLGKNEIETRAFPEGIYIYSIGKQRGKLTIRK